MKGNQMSFNSKAWADLYGETPDDPFARGDKPDGWVTEACPDCSDGMRYEQRDVDDFIPVGACETCNGWGEVMVLCEACEKPFSHDDWEHAEHDGPYSYHAKCWEGFQL